MTNDLQVQAATIERPPRDGPLLCAVSWRRADPSPEASRDSSGREWIERRAKLFEAGDYPDKGVTITQDQLRVLVEGFEDPVPVLIEHADSPLQLGFLTNVEALGPELFGTVALTKEANELVEASGARSLSLGLSKDLCRIREVSLVRKPRVSDAQLFSGVCFCGELAESGEGRVVKCDAEGASVQTLMSEKSDQSNEVQVAPKEENWRRRFEELSTDQRRVDAERTVESLVKEGRLCPAQAPFAEALLQAEDTIEFDGESKPLRQLLLAMIERQPPMMLFSALAPEADREAGEALMLPEEAAFYRKHFPDVSLEEIATRRR
ncbi:MAG: hypothetical protein HZC36_04745 [Armatimonadetes bacterium]|nr:hypothetical protein [Armatimonadota bacterium]